MRPVILVRYAVMNTEPGRHKDHEPDHKAPIPRLHTRSETGGEKIVGICLIGL